MGIFFWLIFVMCRHFSTSVLAPWMTHFPSCMESLWRWRYLLMCVVFQGRITVTGLLDRERGDMYTLTVVADDGGPKKDSTVVRFIPNCVDSSFFSSTQFYFTVWVCSVVESLMAFLFSSLHLSLEEQKVRLALLFKRYMKWIHILFPTIFRFWPFDSPQR